MSYSAYSYLFQSLKSSQVYDSCSISFQESRLFMCIYVHSIANTGDSVSSQRPTSTRSCNHPGVSKLSAACHCNSSELSPFQESIALEFQAPRGSSMWDSRMVEPFLYRNRSKMWFYPLAYDWVASLSRQNGRDVTSHTITGNGSKNTKIGVIGISQLYLWSFMAWVAVYSQWIF